jgi:hypothetical protein
LCSAMILAQGISAQRQQAHEDRPEFHRSTLGSLYAIGDQQSGASQFYPRRPDLKKTNSISISRQEPGRDSPCAARVWHEHSSGSAVLAIEQIAHSLTPGGVGSLVRFPSIP